MQHNIDQTMLETDEATAFPTASPYASETAFEDQLSPADHLALASELLEVTSEEELEDFLGGVFHKVAGAARHFASSARGRAVRGLLKSVIKRALPVVGGIAGNAVVPGLGGIVGARLASGAGHMLGLELEGLSLEDQEFEASRQLVRLASEAVHRASLAPLDTLPEDAAREAVEAAVARFAPGLAASGLHGPDGSHAPLSPLSEEEEEELAGELLEIGNEDELERVIGKVMRKSNARQSAHARHEHHEHVEHVEHVEHAEHTARRPAAPRSGAPRAAAPRSGGRGSTVPRPGAPRPAHRPGPTQGRPQGPGGISGFLHSPAAHALGGALKQVAKTSLPAVSRALGNMVLPGLGGLVGGNLGKALSDLFEIDPEALPQEAEMEAARRFVGLSAAAAHHLARNPHAHADPRAAAWDAVVHASQHYAPGLHRQLTGHPAPGYPGTVHGQPAPGHPGYGHPGHEHNGHGHNGHGHGGHGHEPGPGFGGVEFPALAEPAGLLYHDGEQPMAGTWERRGAQIILHGA